MNRLIIIGNGFDLAHGLKTKYSDFIEYYWKNLKRSDRLVTLESKFVIPDFDSLVDLRRILQNTNRFQKQINFQFENSFFDSLNSSMKNENWVDIEMFYYQKLKAAFKSKNILAITKLNSEFENVKNTFEEYIDHINKNICSESIYNSEIAEIFKPLHNGQFYYTDFTAKLPTKFAGFLDSSCHDLANKRQKLTSKTMILNFNYTNTLSCYNDVLAKSATIINHIHGEAKNDSNKIIFGFGDERDDLFSEMENLNKNEVLHFMKSSFYLQSRNYFDMLNFIEDEEFIIEIMGHSCALSDRTLLKTLFEHPNCAHIFLFYHNKAEHEVATDNYLDLSLNISRHFDDKKLLRSRVANKIFCKSLPQNKKN